MSPFLFLYLRSSPCLKPLFITKSEPEPALLPPVNPDLCLELSVNKFRLLTSHLTTTDKSYGFSISFYPIGSCIHLIFL
jgi:hypothetical protein